MGAALVFFDLVAPQPGAPELQAALKVQAFADRQSFAVHARALQPGTLVRLRGVPGPTRTQGEGLVVISAATVLAPGPDVYHVAQLIRAAQRSELPRASVAAALRMPAGASFDAWLASSGDAVELARGWHSRVANGTAVAPPAVPAHVLNAAAARLRGRSQAVVPTLLRQPPTAATVAAARNVAIMEAPHVAAALQAMPQLVGALRVEGWVQGRRRFEGRATLLDICDEFRATLTTGADSEGAQGEAGRALDANWGARLRLALHPATLSPPSALRAFSEVCAPGARVRALGVASGDSVWVTHMELLRASWQPRALARVVAEVAAGAIDPDEAARSLLLEGGAAEASRLADEGRTSPTDRHWALRAISTRLQSEQSRMGTLSEEQARVLASTARLRERWPVTTHVPRSLQGRTALLPDADPAAHRLAKHAPLARGESAGNEDAPQPPPSSQPTFAASGAGTRSRPPATARLRAPQRAGTWWERNKQPQIEFMLDAVEAFVRERRGQRDGLPLSIVDIGGGKGSLASALVGRFGSDVLVHVVDVARAPVRSGAARAAERGVDNVRFVLADASCASLDEDALGKGCAVDLVVALHACGTLSDVALAQAVRHGAGFVVCPCCFGANGDLRVPVGSSSRPASDGAAPGVAPSALPAAAWLGVDPATHDALLRAAELQGDHGVAAQASHALCALRAEAAMRQWDSHMLGANGDVLGLVVSIVEFPLAFSTRNRCLLGVPQAGE
ncbi:hypothetical protein KFE25_009068 [Diacronema lutheri]|uniref:Methyltransferase domain-containing protein n=1 Tax=Diacronema lutheri TaxID=2081491 RepID=A0A8J6CD65_DIALT|nr:hypothetical protein KFE25_009068 [Diacronema lutheri]